MIIAGYPGIGKSSVARRRIDIIDLESSLFHDEKGLLVKLYTDVAEALSRQGYIVFVSLHDEIQDFLKKTEEKTAIIFPSEDLYKDWVEKLRVRWEETGSQKDFQAYWRAKLNYNNDIETLRDTFYNAKVKTAVCVLHDMDYDLEFCVEGLAKSIL